MKRLKVYGTLYVYGFVIVLIVAFPCSGCSMFGNPLIEPSSRLVEDWSDVRADGTVDAGEVKTIDRDVNYVQAGLDQAQRPLPLPPTGIPWLDIALGVGGMFVTAAGTHRYTMSKRDKSRAEVLKSRPS